MKKAPAAEQSIQVENLLAPTRQAKGLSRVELASQAGITRQAVHAIETNQYLPTTAVALRLADAWAAAWKISSGCFLKKTSLRVNGRTPQRFRRRRRKPSASRSRGGRAIHCPTRRRSGRGAQLCGPRRRPSGSSRGSTGAAASPRRVQVRLLRDRRVIEQEIAVAGCDPSASWPVIIPGGIRDSCTVVGWNLGSTAAIEALKRERCTLRACTLWMRSPESAQLALSAPPPERERLSRGHLCGVGNAGPWQLPGIPNRCVALRIGTTGDSIHQS